MTIRTLFVTIGMVALAACAPQVPDSAQGVGFDTFETRAARDAALARPIYVPDTVQAPDRTGAVDGSAAATALETRRVLDATRPAAQGQAALNSGVEPLQASPSNPAPLALDNPGISDENDFDAVSERQSIESDAARIAQNRAQYQVIQPEALPSRSADTGPNIVQYALQTRHPRGQRLYQRGGFSNQNRFERNCAEYASNDLAQIDFLARGGPERDRKGIDPDGDGYACGWDPTPFRNASGG